MKLPPPPPLGSPLPPRTHSLASEIEAAQTLARSRRMRPIAIWLIGIVSAGASAGLGWIASKVDTLADLQAIRVELVAIRHAQDEHTRAVGALLSEEPPGRIIRLERGQRHVWRAALEARSSALAGETDKVRAVKAAGAAKLVAAFDRRIDDGASPSAAYDEVVDSVALP